MRPAKWQRVEKSSTPGLSVQCAGCGRMVAYDRARINPLRPFRFYHESCVFDEGGEG